MLSLPKGRIRDTCDEECYSGVQMRVSVSQLTSFFVSARAAKLESTQGWKILSVKPVLLGDTR